MRKKIAELATVQIGYQHREKIEPASTGSYNVIQVKDLVTGGRFAEYFQGPVGLWTRSLYMVTPKGPAWKYQVKPGDVLFVAKGGRNVSIAMEPRWIQPDLGAWDNLIASSQYYILRPNMERVLPEFLAWYVNQPPTQHVLLSIAEGTHMKMIPKAEFENLPIDVPPLETQRKIVELHFLAERERRLASTITEKRSLIVRAISLKAAKGQLQTSEKNEL